MYIVELYKFNNFDKSMYSTNIVICSSLNSVNLIKDKIIKKFGYKNEKELENFSDYCFYVTPIELDEIMFDYLNV